MNNSMAPLHPDFAGGAMSGRVPPPNLYNGVLNHLADRDAASSYFPPAPAGVGSYRGYADAIRGGRYAGVAAAGLVSGDLLLPSLSQELRRNHLTPGGFGDGVNGVGQHHRHHQASLILEERLIQEEKIRRQYDAHDRVLEAELAYCALQQQQQQQRQQSELLLTESIDRRIVALKEHQAQQRLLATTVGGAAGDLGSLGWAASQAYGGYSQAEQRLAEEAAAIRERLAHRRVFQHHHGAGEENSFIHPCANSNSLASEPASTYALTRLLQLQQMSDEDLIRRTTEVRQNSILREGLDPRGAGRSAMDSLLERQILEAHLLRSAGGGGEISVCEPIWFNPGATGQAGVAGGGDSGRLHRPADLNLIQQAYADATLRRGLDQGGGRPPPPDEVGYAAVAVGRAHPQPSSLPRQQDQQETLRYFKNGVEVDKDGNPIPIADGDSPASTNPMSPVVLPHGRPLEGLPATENDISRFVTALMNRVPEIGPALAVLLPEDHIASFPYIFDAAKTVLRAMQERCARSTDNVTCDLLMRITACIALVESNSADLGLGAPVSGMALTPPPPIAATMRHAQLLGMAIDPNTLPSPNYPRLDLAGMGFVTARGGSGMVSYPISEAQLAKAHHFQQTTRAISDQSAHAGYAPVKDNNDVPRHHVANSESPIDDNMPMMAMYKSKKKAAMRARKAEKRKRKPKLVHKANASLKTADPTPKTSLVQKLVQHALFRGGFDESKDSSKRRILTGSNPSEDTPIDSPPASPENSDGSSCKSDNAKELNSDSFTYKPDDTVELTSAEEIKSATDDGESQRAKKRRVANQTKSVDNNNNNINNDSIPIDRENRKTDINCGPHGEVLETLFADNVKPSTDNGDANGAESERSAGDETGKEIVTTDGSPKSKKEIDKPMEPSSREAASTPEDDAVSVLMGLMGK